MSARTSFETAAVKPELERSLGFPLASLKRLDGASAYNFKAVRAADGLPFAVKVFGEERQALGQNLLLHLDAATGTKGVRRLFCDRRLEVFGCEAICLVWSDGVRTLPDRLADEDLAALVEDYRIFSEAINRHPQGVLPRFPVENWRDILLSTFAARPGLRWFGDWLARNLPAADCTYDESALRVLHGDFHHGNVLFRDGRIDVILDLEEFRYGYPAEDFVRYFVCAAEHLRWYDVPVRRAAIYAVFGRLVRRLPYSADRWIVAVNGLLLRKIAGAVYAGRFGRRAALDIVWRMRVYARLKEIARRECSHS